MPELRGDLTHQCQSANGYDKNLYIKLMKFCFRVAQNGENGESEVLERCKTEGS